MLEENGVGVYLYHRRGDSSIRMDPHIGQRVPLHATALGRTILAHLPDESTESILEEHELPKYTSQTIADRTKLREELRAVREEGIAFDDEMRHEGLRCVAAPILDNGDRVLGAISVSGPISDFHGERFRSELPAIVEDAANTVCLKLARA
ncbi:IclR family transcriptional regulator [Halosimplex sp. TS25]|uniref:IclR family transcriptional regulator n=1 Tax=Halosimplex rarum TaxID=3396619 RepID=UPI0039EAD4C1